MVTCLRLKVSQPGIYVHFPPNIFCFGNSFHCIDLGLVNGQLAAVYSNVSRTNDCSSWSSWGPCIWPDAKTKLPYWPS
uniref:Uncharacterized protein n=1 Tax=Ditylenchus dipsaci TaxID=166011 RepID=A0A915CQP1_9BILA